MTKKAMTYLQVLILLVASSAGAAAAKPHRVPSSDLLLPYFELDLAGSGPTTFFAVVNSSTQQVPVKISLFTNWGIEVMSSLALIDGHEVLTINLRSWILDGELPDKTLSEQEIDHCQAALSGQLAADDGLYYSSETVPGHAVGYVKIGIEEGAPRLKVLFGDSFIVDPGQDFAQGDVLVDVKTTGTCKALAQRHGLRFLSGGGFDSGTEVLIWTNEKIAPSPNPVFPNSARTSADLYAFKESGDLSDFRELGFLPLEVLTVSDLGLSSSFGWLDLFTEEDSFIAVRYSADNRYSVGLQTFCIPDAN